MVTAQNFRDCVGEPDALRLVLAPRRAERTNGVAFEDSIADRVFTRNPTRAIAQLRSPALLGPAIHGTQNNAQKSERRRRLSFMSIHDAEPAMEELRRVVQEIRGMAQAGDTGDVFDKAMEYAKDLLDSVDDQLADEGGDGVAEIRAASRFLREKLDGVGQWPCGDTPPTARVGGGSCR